MIPRSGKKNDFLGMMTWHIIPCHINLGLHIPCHNFKIKNYLVQRVTI